MVVKYSLENQALLKNSRLVSKGKIIAKD